MTSKDELFCNSWTILESLVDFIPIVVKTTVLLPESMMGRDQQSRVALAEFPQVTIVYLPNSDYLPIEQPLISSISVIERLDRVDWTKYAQDLLDRGYAVIPVLDREELVMFNESVKAEMGKFPEYLHPQDPETIFIYSGFGALGNPSSYHNPTVRSLRLRMMFPAVKLVEQLNILEGRNRNLEQLCDRLSVRRKGTSTTAESFHKDQAPLPDPNDDVMGGWINLDLKEDQYFSGVPGTHKDTRGKSGFARLTEEQVTHAKKNKVRMVIPPGHWFVFWQNLTHEVVPGKMKYNMLRLYTGFRLTMLKDRLFSQANRKVLAMSKDFVSAYDPKTFDYEALMDAQGCPPGPSGQAAAMYAKMNMIFPKQRETLQQWSRETFRPECLETITIKGEDVELVQRNMDSLEEYGFTKYRGYSDYEMDILKPSAKWRLPLYGKMQVITL